MVPNSRKTFKEYVLRKLGAPTVTINVDDDQVEDRIDEALLYFADYHFDGSLEIYYKQELTDTIIQNQYFPMPDNIIGAVSIFDISSSLNTGGFFNIQYQIALNDLYTLTSQSMVPYWMAMQHVQFLQQMLVGQQPIRYNRHEGNLYVDMDWSRVSPGAFLVVRAYQALDPEQFPKVWGDRWLQLYGQALIGEQWATNLSKYKGIQLPGGVVYDADGLLNRYSTMRAKLEEEMLTSYSIPAAPMMG